MRTRLTLALFLAAPLVRAQSTAATLTGRITDPSGAGIPAVAVSVSNVNTGIRRETRSDGQGYYQVPLLPPGTYRVELHKDGFKPLTRDGVVLQVDQVARLDFGMELGTQAQAIEVTGTAPLLDQETSSLGQVIGSTRIDELPLNGRNVMTLVNLTAGANPVGGMNAGFAESGNFFISNIAINGGRAEANLILLDGTPNVNIERGEIGVTPSVDAVQEFKVASANPPAEYGFTEGGIISFVTKSGVNRLHGDAYEFVRNEKLDALTAFVPTKAPYRWNDFGGTFGGPVVIPKVYDGHNRTFFFFSYEGTRYINYKNNLLTAPTELERSGDFSQTFGTNGKLIPIFDTATTRRNPAGAGYVRDPFPGNVIPSNRFDAIAAKVMSYIPGPNRTPSNPITHGNNYYDETRTLTNNDQWMGRFDHQLTAKDSLTYRLAYNRNDILPDPLFGNFLGPGGNATDNFYRNYQQAMAGWTRVISPRSLNEFRASYVLTELERTPPGNGADVNVLGFPPIIPRINVPQMGIQDFNQLGGGQIVDSGEATIFASDTFTKILGSHHVKFGGEAWALRKNRFQFGALSGNFSFNRDMTQNPQAPTGTGYGVATFLMGAVSTGSMTIGEKEYDRAKLFAGFIQDDWRVKKNLTLNFGVRYEVQTNPYSPVNQQSDFNLTRINPLANLPGVLDYAGVNYHGSPIPTDWNNFGPRFGFAWSLGHSAQTVVRGGYGILYSPSFSGNSIGELGNLGWSATTRYTNTSIGPLPPFYLSQGPGYIQQPPGNSLGPAGFLGSAVSLLMPPDRIPYIQQWNLGVQRALRGDWMLEAAYVGSKGTKIHAGGASPEDTNLNQLNPIYLPLGLTLQQQVPNPFHSIGAFGTTVAQSQLLLPFPAYLGVTAKAPHWGSSIYHALQVRVQKRMSGLYTLMLSYTAGKLIDDVPASMMTSGYGENTGVGAYQNIYDRRAERSTDPADVAQQFVLNHVITLPFGKGKRWLHSGPFEPILGGWELNGVTTIKSGLPLAITGAQNFAASRPNSTGRSAQLSGGERSAARWFNTSAFSAPPLYTYGNVGRVLPDVRGPGILNFDMSAGKSFAIGERFRLQIRGEAFNIFNHLELGLPNTGLLSATFGQINSTVVPARIIQLGCKLVF